MSRTWAPSEHGQERGAIQGRVVRGLMWTLIDTWGSQLLALIIFAILAHLLSPDDFGLVALAAVFVALGQLFVDQGLGDAVVQRRSLTRRQVDTAFWAAVPTGLVLTVVGVLAAGPIAAALHQPRLEQILQVLSLVFVIVALTSIQTGILFREMDFRSLALRRLLAQVTGGVVGIAAALLGAGAWALVVQQLAAGATSVVVLWAASPWRPSLAFSASDFRTLLGYGVNVVGSDFLGFLNRNTDNLLIGVFLGSTALGFYAVAYRILDTSQVILVAAARRLVFPSFARLQHDIERTRNAYLRMTRVASTLILPGYIGLALVAHEMIVAFFGAKWAPATTAASVLFLIGPVLTVQAFSGAVWNAVGRPDVTLRFRLLATGATVGGFALAIVLFRDITAVAAAFVLPSYLLLPLNLYWTRLYAGASMRDQLSQERSSAVATLAMVVAVIALKLALGSGVHVALLLAAEVIVGAAVYYAALWLVDRSLLRDIVSIGLLIVPSGERYARRLGLRLSVGGPNRSTPAASPTPPQPSEPSEPSGSLEPLDPQAAQLAGPGEDL